MQLNLNNPKVKRLVIIGGILFVTLLGWQLYRMSQFHIVKTDPKLSSVSIISPYLRVYFNDEISEEGLKITDENEVISSTTVKGKVLTFNFDQVLNLDVPHSITIKSITNVHGEKLTDVELRFTPKKIGSADLSKEQRGTLINRQDRDLYEVDHLNYPGFDELIDRGLTTEQQRSIKLSLYAYSVSINEKFWTMELVKGSVVKPPTTRGSAERSVDFSVILDKEKYNAHAEYNVLYDSVYLQLRSLDGVLVFDSANVGD